MDAQRAAQGPRDKPAPKKAGNAARVAIADRAAEGTGSGFTGRSDLPANASASGNLIFVPGRKTLAAFSRQQGRWSRQAIDEGTEVHPAVVTQELAIVQAGATLYAYSASLGTWQSLPEMLNEPVSPTVIQDLATVRVGRTLYAFSAVSGTWDGLELEE